ncbi:MAG: biotin/lipoyl-containing protein, partial [Terriglobia bacterium]
MPTKILVPELGESVLEATVGHWHKEEGEPVSPGDVLVELETDKVDLEVGAERGGVLAHIERQEGEDVKIGDVLGLIEEWAAGAKPPASRSAAGPDKAAGAHPSAPAPAPAESAEPAAKAAETHPSEPSPAPAKPAAPVVAAPAPAPLRAATP